MCKSTAFTGNRACFSEYDSIVAQFEINVNTYYLFYGSVNTAFISPESQTSLINNGREKKNKKVKDMVTEKPQKLTCLFETCRIITC